MSFGVLKGNRVITRINLAGLTYGDNPVSLPVPPPDRAILIIPPLIQI